LIVYNQHITAQEHLNVWVSTDTTQA
jgi:hypothetical protein